jgi:hypothetical protein
MLKPRHGTLLQNDKYEWFFCPGTSKDITLGTLLHDLLANCQNLIDTGQLFRGYTKFCRIHQTRNQNNFDIVCYVMYQPMVCLL